MQRCFALLPIDISAPARPAEFLKAFSHAGGAISAQLRLVCWGVHFFFYTESSLFHPSAPTTIFFRTARWREGFFCSLKGATLAAATRSEAEKAVSLPAAERGANSRAAQKESDLSCLLYLSSTVYYKAGDCCADVSFHFA